jgi:hypothetical protein
MKVIQDLQALPEIVAGKENRTIVWILCHYPEHPEMDERINQTVEVWKAFRLPIWVFGTVSARYPESVEKMVRDMLVSKGVDPKSIFCSVDFGNLECLDTVQEMVNIARTAEAKGIEQVICISNSLQLLQVHGLMRHKKIEWVYLPTTLKDWRWWYVSVRAVLIPVAFAGVGRNFGPLQFVRKARAAWKSCPF